MTGVIVLAVIIIMIVIIVTVLAASLWRNRKRPTGVLSVPERIECERCGVVRVTSDDKRVYTYPEDFPDDRAALCRTRGHVWLEVLS